MSRSEDYVTVDCLLSARTPKAVLLLCKETGARGWVPRSCLHFSSDKAVDGSAIGDELELKMMEWVAGQRGFL
jgi:hypothetical protein